VKRGLKASSAHAQQAQGYRNSLDALGELLTTEEAAARLRYDGPRAVANFFAWADRNRVPRLHRGARVLWQASVLTAYLTGEKWTRVHAQKVAPFSSKRTGNTVAVKSLDGGGQ
jgi:hypothetical protein